MTRASTLLKVVITATGVMCALAVLSARQDSPQTGAPNRIAVVRPDGVIVPFAQYEKGRWKPIWTGLEGPSHPLPITLEDVDRDWWGEGGPALEWWLWQKPDRATALTVSGVRPVGTPCSAETGLETGFRGEGILPPTDETPYPKAGFATTAPVYVELITRLRRDSAEWPRVRDAVARDFDRLEGDALVAMRWGHPTPSRERRKASIDLQSVWHVPGGRFYFVEAMRRYPERKTPAGKPPCDLVTFVAGFFWEERDGTLRPVQVNALVSYCHLERAVFARPLGLIRDGAKRFWITEAAGWTGEGYGIFEMRPERGDVRQHVWHVAGQCDLR